MINESVPTDFSLFFIEKNYAKKFSLIQYNQYIKKIFINLLKFYFNLLLQLPFSVSASVSIWLSLFLPLFSSIPSSLPIDACEVGYRPVQMCFHEFCKKIKNSRVFKVTDALMERKERERD